MSASGGLFRRAMSRSTSPMPGIARPRLISRTSRSHALVAGLREAEVLSDGTEPAMELGDRGIAVVEPLQRGNQPRVHPRRRGPHSTELAGGSVPRLGPNRNNFATQCCKAR